MDTAFFKGEVMDYYVLGCDVIQEELNKHIPEGWKILRAIENTTLGCNECDPEGIVSIFTIVFEDTQGMLRVCEFNHSYHGGVLDEKSNAYYVARIA